MSDSRPSLLPVGWCVAIAASCAGAVLAGCQLLFPTVADQGRSEAGADAPDSDASTDGPFSIEKVSNYGLAAAGSIYAGGTFDGRFVYFAPVQGLTARYDTQADFVATGSWTTFSTTKLDDGGGPNIFSGAAFDGRYVYLVSNDDGLNTHAVFVRYDTKGPFESTSSWETFDATGELALPSYMSFSGAAFDGKSVYFIPSFFSIALSFDTSGAFSAKSSWKSFDVKALGKKAGGLRGAIFDGKYVYMIPSENYVVLDGGAEKQTPVGLMLRYDTALPFEASGSWATFDLSTLTPRATGFRGAAFDGRYLYLAPYYNAAAEVVRYDTRASFTEASSFAHFDVTSLNLGASGFSGAAFDGRYVYLVPHINTSADGLLARYDTQRTFTGKDAWSFFDLSTVNPAAVDFFGAVFDGEYLYFVPYSDGVVTRLRARTPRQLPKLPEFTGSFY